MTCRRFAAFPSTVLPFLALTALAATACGGGEISHGQARSPTTQTATPSPGTGYADEAVMPSGAPPEMDSPAAEAGYSAAEKSAPAPRTASAPVASRAGAAGRPTSPSAAPRAAYEPAPAPRDDRPGLGTEWGEARESRVSSAPFERQGGTPLTATSFFYNDESGVRAALGDNYWNSSSDGISAARGAITIHIVDEQGAALPTFSAGGRSYVIGNNGGRYAIRIENQTGARFEAVATVDGLDVIDGQPGAFEKRGYLVGAWSNVEIDGFRRSEAEVAAFRFGRVHDSYAAKRGSDRNVGVIGVAVFQERGSSWPWTQHELDRRGGADAFPGRFAPAPR